MPELQYVTFSFPSEKKIKENPKGLSPSTIEFYKSSISNQGNSALAASLVTVHKLNPVLKLSFTITSFDVPLSKAI